MRTEIGISKIKFFSKLQNISSNIFLVLFILVMFFPLYLALVAASNDAALLMQAPVTFIPGTMLWENIRTVLFYGVVSTDQIPVALMLLNSFIMAMIIAAGKVLLAMFSAFSLVFFRFPFKKLCFILIFLTLMLPIEVRVIPTFQIVASFGWLNTYSGLTLPLMASATATFLFRQFFKTIPETLVDAAIIDGASPIRFFKDILLPLSKTQIAALFIIMFVYGWNQYLWPLVTTTDPQMSTIVMGIYSLSSIADQIPQWHYIMAVSLIALLPPCLIVVIFARWFEKGLGE